jgi:hypothetical protein
MALDPKSAPRRRSDQKNSPKCAWQSYWVLTLPPASSVTFTVNPSFTALPRQIPLESLRSPETFGYPAAST